TNLHETLHPGSLRPHCKRCYSIPLNLRPVGVVLLIRLDVADVLPRRHDDGVKTREFRLREPAFGIVAEQPGQPLDLLGIPLTGSTSGTDGHVIPTCHQRGGNGGADHASPPGHENSSVSHKKLASPPATTTS